MLIIPMSINQNLLGVIAQWSYTCRKEHANRSGKEEAPWQP